MYAHMLLAALIEVALLIARSENGATIQTGQIAVERFLHAVVGGELKKH